jgi:hypothetical protein
MCIHDGRDGVLLVDAIDRQRQYARVKVVRTGMEDVVVGILGKRSQEP